MKRTRLLIPISMALLIVSSVAAQSGGTYDLSWSTIDNGGGSSSGGNYTVEGTLGQPDTGVLSGGGYTVNGGFWFSTGVSYQVYLPVVMR